MSACSFTGVSVLISALESGEWRLLFAGLCVVVSNSVFFWFFFSLLFGHVIIDSKKERMWVSIFEGLVKSGISTEMPS